MTKIKISDFKMLDKAPYKLPELKALTDIFMIAIKESGKIYGLLYNAEFIKSALEFVAKKYGEKPPEDIKTLDQFVDYLVSISHKYPTAYNAIIYAGFKTEKWLRTGAGIRLGAINISRSVVKSSSVKERKVDVESLLSKYRQTTIDMMAANYELGYKKNEDESINMIWPTCYIKDGCRMSFDEGILTRPIGGLQCSHCEGILQFFKLFTGYDWDYKLLEFDKPYCIANICMF